MALVRSGALWAVLFGAGVYASCSSASSPDNEDGDEAGGGAGDSFGLGGSVGGSSNGGAAGRSGQGGSSNGAEAGDSTGTAGADGGEQSGGTGGSDTGGATSGASGTAGASGANGGNAGAGGANGGNAGAGGGPTMPCGNGRIDSGENCDDGGMAPNDGCSASCQIESGFDCQGAPSACFPTTCGNMTVQGAEACDDGNALPFDGCTPDCRREPTCVSGMPCSSPCGDGIIHAEECDDGNLRNGDGCSSTCHIETGFTCEAEAPCQMRNGSCTLGAPIVFRDFNRATAAGGHPDFQPGYSTVGAITGLVEARLDAAGKPVLSSTASVTNGFMHGAQSFAQWFRDGAPASAPIPRSLVLWDGGDGTFVNRWGANGERWKSYQNATFCGNSDCSACGTPPEGMVCRAPCPPWGTTYACFVTEVSYDGDPLFFPIDAAPGLLTDMRTAGKVPEQYGFMGWPWETDVATLLGVTTPVQTASSPFPTATHNFHFTSEVRLWFHYDPNVQQRIAFTGDDDAWVFVNGRLAIDLGGWHVPLSKEIVLDPTAYSLTAGNLYEVAVFHAERQTEGSSFRLGLSSMANPKSRCQAR